jgi:protein TonB
MEGRCVLRVMVGADGLANFVQISQSSGYSLLDQAAIAAVKTWRFVPAKRNGQAITDSVTVPIRFNLNDN